MRLDTRRKSCALVCLRWVLFIISNMRGSVLKNKPPTGAEVFTKKLT
jgi:hypothetical protein